MVLAPLPIVSRTAGLFLLLLLALRLPAAAAEDANWIVQSWYVADGLPNNNVAGLAQGEDGHLWIAMPDCIARFDGVHFERFGPEDLGIDGRHRLRTIARLTDGALWVGADQDGALRLKDGELQSFSRNVNQAMESLLETADGAVWVTYLGGEVRRIRDGAERRFTAEDGVPARSRCSLATDSEGRIWFGKSGQIGVVENDRFVTKVRVNGSTTRVAHSPRGGIWICANFQLWKYRLGGSLQTLGTFQPPGVRGEINVMLEDRTGAVWLGTSSCGLIRYDGASFHSVPISDREVTSLMEDNEGNIWAGTVGGGLNRIRPRGVRLESVAEGMPAETIQSLCQTQTGELWAATSNGRVARKKDGAWKVVTEDWTQAIRAVTAVCADSRGALWISTSVHELHCWHEGVLRTYRAADGLVSRTVRVLHSTRNGDLLAAGEGPSTIQRIRDGKFFSYAVPTGGPHFRAVVEDRSGRIWIGGQRGALLRLEEDRAIDESAPLGGTQSTLRTLHVTPDDALWIGFGRHGVGRLRAGKFATIGRAQGLFHHDISQIVSDDHGWLWFGSDRGIFKVRQEELDAVADGRAGTVQSVFFGRSQGLPSLQAHYGDWPATVQAGDGQLYLPMRSGVAVINPGKLHSDPAPPAVLLKQVSLDGRAVVQYGNLLPLRSQRRAEVAYLDGAKPDVTLAPAHRHVVFDFTALSLGGAENVQFRYRLEGFDRDWQTTHERSASYPRLEAGDYRFSVIARNREGVWAETGPEFAFRVAPFFWQRWWFRAGVVALFAVGVGALVRYVSFRRLRRKLDALERQSALEKERARIARDIHDDVGNRLTEISLLTELALRDGEKPSNGSYVQQISSTVRHVTDSLDEIIWAVSPRNDTLPSVIHYIGEFAIEFLRTAGITCRLELPDQIPARHVSAEIRHNLFLAVKEALHNVVRHAGAAEVRLRVRVNPDSLAIAVRDNGKGFAQDKVNDPGADGLRNMRQRMEEIDGTFSLHSQPGQGTEITFAYPWREETTHAHS